MLAPLVPSSCDVLVIGAGPAGSACAQRLAAGGMQVLIADQHAFPRDKVCGDGLIPDALAALRRMGVHDEVAALAQPVAHVRCVGPRGGHVDVPGHLSVLPRKTLDHVLLRAAQRAGARLLPPLRFEAPLLDGARIVGARLRPGVAREQGGGASAAEADTAHEITARWTVLATGAVPQALIAAGLCERRTPTGVALRGYVRNPAQAAHIRQLQVVWHPRLRGGYGWVFPAPGGIFNIGAGLTSSHRTRGGRGRMQDVNLREMFQTFCAIHPPAAALMQGGELLGELKGAPLRCSLAGARWSRPGLLATGEAIGSTYAFSGEGIGKAMETGMLAADALLHPRHPVPADADVQQRYEAALRALKPRFDLYDLAGHVNQHPWLADVVVWRARRSPSILRRLAGVLDETQNPGRLFSWRGVGKLLFE